MNIANILTIARIFITPLFVLFIEIKNADYGFKLIALIIFIIASITDMLDGLIARKYKLITNLGQFLDPLADKILTSAAFLCFLDLKIINIWVVLIIFSREFLVTGVRLIASKNNIVLAANFWGKLKTVTQIFACISCILFLMYPKNLILYYQYNILIYASVILTIVSGYIYIYNNKKLFKV